MLIARPMWLLVVKGVVLMHFMWIWFVLGGIDMGLLTWSECFFVHSMQLLGF